MLYYLVGLKLCVFGTHVLYNFRFAVFLIHYGFFEYFFVRDFYKGIHL